MVMVNLGSTDDSRYTGYREITDRDVLDLQCILSAENCSDQFSSFFSSRKLSVGWQDLRGLDYTASHTIWVSLISVTKWQETSFNKCHEHILLIIFIIYDWLFLLFIIDLHVFL